MEEAKGEFELLIKVQKDISATAELCQPGPGAGYTQETYTLFVGGSFRVCVYANADLYIDTITDIYCGPLDKINNDEGTHVIDSVGDALVAGTYTYGNTTFPVDNQPRRALVFGSRVRYDYVPGTANQFACKGTVNLKSYDESVDGESQKIGRAHV